MLSWTRMEVASCGFPSTFHCLVFTSHVPKTDALPTALHSGFFTLINNLTAIYLANQRISNRFCRLLHAKQSLKGLPWVAEQVQSNLRTKCKAINWHPKQVQSNKFAPVPSKPCCVAFYGPSPFYVRAFELLSF